MCVKNFVDDPREVLIGQLSLDVASQSSATTDRHWK